MEMMRAKRVIWNW